jgi:hypothetical protein
MPYGGAGTFSVLTTGVEVFDRGWTCHILVAWTPHKYDTADAYLQKPSLHCNNVIIYIIARKPVRSNTNCFTECLQNRVRLGADDCRLK